MKNSISSYENILYIDGHKLPAVQSVDMSYEVPHQPLNILGEGYTKHALSSGPIGQISVSRVMTHKDPLSRLTGDFGTEGALNWQGKNFGFEDAYLNSYSVSFDVNNMPTTTVNLTSYALEIGSNLNSSSSEPELEIQPVSRGTIEVECSGSATNRVTQCSFEARVNRTPIYTFGQEEPIEVKAISPIEVDFNFTVEMDDYETKSVINHLLEQEKQDVSIKVRNVSGFNYTQPSASPYSPSWSGRITVMPSGLKGGNLFRTGELVRLQNTQTNEIIDREINSIIEGTYANLIGFSETLPQNFIVDETSDPNFGNVKVFPFVFCEKISDAHIQKENVSAAVGAENSITLNYKGYLPI